MAYKIKRKTYKAVGKGYLLGYTSNKQAFLREYKKTGWKKKDIKFVEIKKKK
jgi:hypothetical protein